MPFDFKQPSSQYKPSWTHTCLREKAVHYGKTIITTKFITKGTVLAIFKGQHITSEQAKIITASDSEDSDYITQVGEDTWLLPLKREKADYFNHCCEPNCGFDQKRELADTLIAIRDILPNEAITYHYAFTDVDAEYEFECQCQAPSCVGTFSSCINHQKEFIEKYWDYLAPFLKQRISSGRHYIQD